MRIGEKLPALFLSFVVSAVLARAFSGPPSAVSAALAQNLPDTLAPPESGTPQPPFHIAQARSAVKAEPVDKAAQHDDRQERISLTAFPKFENACIEVTDGYEKLPGQGEKLVPVFRPYQGTCGAGRKSKPMVFGVTHENDHNNHNGAANYNRNISAYMGDFDPKTDLGQWLDLQLINTSTPPSIKLKLDTADFEQTNVTGWPIQFGHMFIGLNDGTATAALDRPVYVEFEIKIETKPISQRAGYSGRRVMVGAIGSWDEAPPRTNRQHFLEIDLVQSEGYSASYNEQLKPLCHDMPYDRCFYSNGPYAEGREVRYEMTLRQPHVPDTTKGWVPIRIPLSELFHRLKWVSPPSEWAKAQLAGLYIGIESTGETATQIEVQNYEVDR